MKAVVLNRAAVYSSSRRHLTLHWRARLLLRIVPILLFLYQIYTLLRTLRCQTGTNIPRLRFTESEKVINAAFTGDGGFLHRASSALLFWESEYESCEGVNMVPLGENVLDFVGSSSVLWPLFLSLCLSALMETISCALQGRQPMAETGMTIFEHSLAFAEAEAVLRSSINPALFGVPKSSSSASATPTSVADPESTADAAIQTFRFTRPMIIRRLNVPPEVLLIGLLSSCSHLSSNVLGLCGLQARYRLVNTSIWGILFMVAFVWSFVRFFHSTSDLDVTVIRYPTVCIIGFIPHIMVVLGILVCAMIYTVALTVTLLSPPSPQLAHLGFMDRLRAAHGNLQANASLSNIKISWEEDFYTTLLKVGFAVLTNASEAVYFNEGTNVTLRSTTWLEEKRYDELVRSSGQRRRRSIVPPELQGDSSVAEGIGLVDEEVSFAFDGAPLTSGFARERKTTKTHSKVGAAAIREEGVGGSQRSGRWTMSWKLLHETFSLIVCCFARLIIKTFRKLNVRRIPFGGRLLTYSRLVEGGSQEQVRQTSAKPLDFWLLSDHGDLSLPNDRNVDVEVEMRKRLENGQLPGARRLSDDKMDSNLYSWWKNNGWWGDLDSSGEYIPTEPDDDATSMVSFATSASHHEDDRESVASSGWGSESDDGCRTPTQVQPRYSRESTPSISDPITNLAHLLDPKTIEDRQAAKLLARRLQNTGPMTRHQYQQLLDRDRSRVLAPNHPALKTGKAPYMTPEEEEDLLEQIILSRRVDAPKSDPASSGNLWTDGAEGMGSEGPQCVVCHSSPRTILVWPCRCLSLCEECRVSLAMNNFGSCVCCRRDVVAFSRLFVP